MVIYKECPTDSYRFKEMFNGIRFRNIFYLRQPFKCTCVYVSNLAETIKVLVFVTLTKPTDYHISILNAESYTIIHKTRRLNLSRKTVWYRLTIRGILRPLTSPSLSIYKRFLRLPPHYFLPNFNRLSSNFINMYDVETNIQSPFSTTKRRLCLSRILVDKIKRIGIRQSVLTCRCSSTFRRATIN